MGRLDGRGAWRTGPHSLRHHPWVMVWTMSVAQVISWGTLYYTFSLFVIPMQQSLGWSLPLLNGALSLGLLCTAAVAFPVGKWIDQRGARGVMTLGSCMGGFLLLAWSFVESPWALYLIWVGIGASLAGVLYEPAFAVITATFGAQARRGITAMTLVGGFASTVFMPVTQMLINTMGWRHTLLVLGGMNLAICLPLHFYFVPASTAKHASLKQTTGAQAPPQAHPIQSILRGRVFVGLAIWFTACNTAAVALFSQFVPLLTTWGINKGTIMASVALVGPMQVAGRIVLMLLSNRLETRTTGMVVLVMLPASILTLLFLPHTALALGLCTALYGAANGIMTIVRGTAVSDLIGREHYGTINGALTVPIMMARAAAPFIAATLWSIMGDPTVMLWTLLGGIGLGAVGFGMAVSGASRGTGDAPGMVTPAPPAHTP